MLERKKIEKAAYIQERKATEEKDITEEKEIWIHKIKLPKQCENIYYNTYGKNEKEFFNCIVSSYEIEKKSLDWEIQIEKIFENYDESTVESVKFGIPNNLSTHPFILFSACFVNYAEVISTVSNEVVKSTMKQKIIEIVMHNATKVLLEKLWEYKGERTIKSTVCYEEFISVMLTKKWLEDFFCEYPLLFRVILDECGNVLRYYEEVDHNLKKDYGKLKENLNISGELKKIEANAGDSHRGKKQVLVMEFECGKVLYKPRNLGVDEAFNSLIDYVNKNLNTNIKTAKVCNNINYGWQEFVTYTECESEVQVKTYYKNMGMLSCLLYIFMATDMHMENIIVNGSCPVFIDLESLFQGYKGKIYRNKNIYQTIGNEIKDSILSTCLFPGQMSSQPGSDISGITGHGQQIEPNARFVFENLYTSDMKIVRKDYILEDEKNLPKLEGVFVEPRNYIKEIVMGFSVMYQFISENRNEFISKNGILTSFYNLPIRTIMRDTASYAILLKAATEPKYMKDAAMRQQLFDRLWNIAGEMDKFNDIVPYEIHDLLEGDVPYFSSVINSKNIYSSQGKEITGYYEKTINDQIADRIKNMDAGNENAQIDLIKKSLAYPVKRWEFKENKKDYTISLTDCIMAEASDLIEESKKVFEMIKDLAYQDKSEKDIGWLNLNAASNSCWAFMPMDNTLYEGTLGVGIFAAQLYKLTGDENCKEILESIIGSSHKFEKLYRNGMVLSAYSGNASIAYGYYYIGCIMNSEILKKEAVEQILLCKSLIKMDKMFDIISGCAGALIVALRLYEREHINELLEFAVECGEHLLEHVFIENEMYGWQPIAGDGQVLAGMSHGNAGISWALLELYRETKDDRYLKCAKRAIKYENTLYNHRDNNWSDKRSKENRLIKGFPEPVNWCHGAPGIGLSRILCKEIVPQIIDDKDIKCAIQKTIAAGYGGSDCQCHGSFGNMEILLKAAELYGNEPYYEIARKIAGDLILESRKQGWICGIPQKTYVAGFMTGLSGIGYGLLRVLNPKEVPSILEFKFPKEK